MGVYLRHSALVGPGLEVEVAQGQHIVRRLDVIGENVAVGHFVRIRCSGVCRARSSGYQRKKTIWRTRGEEGQQVSLLNGARICQLPKQCC